MEDVNAKVLYAGYGFKLLHTQRSRTGFICRTDKGYVELKKNNIGEGLLQFEAAAREYIYGNGFTRIGRYHTALDGRPFYYYDGNKFVAEKYIPSSAVDFLEGSAWPGAAKALAEFHLASKGFSCQVSVSNIGRLPQLYEKRSNELGKIKKWVASRSKLSKVDMIVKKYYDYYKDMAAKSLFLLEQAGYGQLMEQARAEQGLCHNAFKGENVRKNEYGEFYITGLYKCAYDYGIIDLAELVRRYLKGTEWNMSIIHEMIDSYNCLKPVSEQDIKLLCAILTYPYKFFKLCNEHYNKRRVYVSDAIIQNMERCINQKDRTEEVLKELSVQ